MTSIKELEAKVRKHTGWKFVEFNMNSTKVEITGRGDFRTMNDLTVVLVFEHGPIGPVRLHEAYGRLSHTGLSTDDILSLKNMILGEV